MVWWRMTWWRECCLGMGGWPYRGRRPPSLDRSPLFIEAPARWSNAGSALPCPRSTRKLRLAYERCSLWKRCGAMQRQHTGRITLQLLHRRRRINMAEADLALDPKMIAFRSLPRPRSEGATVALQARGNSIIVARCKSGRTRVCHIADAGTPPIAPRCACSTSALAPPASPWCACHGHEPRAGWSSKT